MSVTHNMTLSSKSDKLGIRIDAVRDTSSLHGIASQWNQLAEKSPERLPMSSYAWVVSYLEHAIPSLQDWSVLLAYRGDTLIGVLPLLHGPGRSFGIPRVDVQTPFDDHITGVGILSDSNEAVNVIHAVLEGINGIFPGNYSLAMRRLPETSPSLDALHRAKKTADVVAEPDGIGSYFPVTQSLDTSLDRLSSNFRKNLKKARKRLSALPDVETAFVTGNDANERHLEALMNVEASGWKGRSGTAIQNSPGSVRFYRALTKRLREAGWLEWQFLMTEGRIIAAQMSTRIGRSLVLCKIAYDEEFSQVSPGNMLFEKTVEHCCGLGNVDEIDCLTDMQWHRNWQMEMRLHYKVTIFPRRLTSWLTGSMPIRMKMRLRKVPAAARVHDVLKSSRGANES
jgi:CelD/BcsL family acetyltransferase involved in cellulose biosynthesis